MRFCTPKERLEEIRKECDDIEKVVTILTRKKEEFQMKNPEKSYPNLDMMLSKKMWKFHVWRTFYLHFYFKKNSS